MRGLYADFEISVLNKHCNMYFCVNPGARIVVQLRRLNLAKCWCLENTKTPDSSLLLLKNVDSIYRLEDALGEVHIT